jgi:hypothetical protein
MIIIAALFSEYILGFYWGKGVISDAERDVIQAGQRFLRRK